MYNLYRFTSLNVLIVIVIIIHNMIWTGLVLIVYKMAASKRHILHYPHLATTTHPLQVFSNVYWLTRLVLPAPQSLLPPPPFPKAVRMTLAPLGLYWLVSIIMIPGGMSCFSSPTNPPLHHLTYHHLSMSPSLASLHTTTFPYFSISFNFFLSDSCHFIHH